ncbi:hypothetical protein [Mycobacterium lentiflavum]|uniref:hypothetical protein n=1 Tax=Mycobacterium lentiflavum TaxID=141349 RepID=UPI000B87952D|nr:hypothetical protein [Mycobacterium lentiflavum]
MSSVTISPHWGSLRVAAALRNAVARSKSGTISSEAGLLHDNQSRYPIGEAGWIAAGIILLLAFGDVLVVLALALVIAGVIAAVWSYRQVHREQHDGDLAPVTRLRPAPAVHRHPVATPIQGPSAA